ncbi:hypothetical protein [Halosimplex sp. J119]
MSWFGRLFDGIGGERGRAWAGSAEDLLYDGETVEQRVDLGGDDRVVVTSHRLLAFTPDGSGENYRDIDLPNVTDVRVGHEGERNLLWMGGRILVYGVVLLALGVFVDFASFVPTDAFGETGAAGQLGMGGLLAMLQQFLDVIARIDEFARLIGAVLLLFAVFVFGVYVVTRDRVLVIDVAGDEDPIRVPADDDGLDAAVADLEVVLFGSGAAAGSTTDETPSSPESGVGAESDPLSPGSGAVESQGFVADAEQSEVESVTQPTDGVTRPADGTAKPRDAAARDSGADVERAVRETNQTDFTEAVDRVVEGASDDPESDGDGFGDANERIPENTDEDTSEDADDDRDDASDPGFEFGG